MRRVAKCRIKSVSHLDLDPAPDPTVNLNADRDQAPYLFSKFNIFYLIQVLKHAKSRYELQTDSCTTVEPVEIFNIVIGKSLGEKTLEKFKLCSSNQNMFKTGAVPYVRHPDLNIEIEDSHR